MLDQPAPPDRRLPLAVGFLISIVLSLVIWGLIFLLVLG
jgi:hypothetical protein